MQGGPLSDVAVPDVATPDEPRPQLLIDGSTTAARTLPTPSKLHRSHRDALNDFFTVKRNDSIDGFALMVKVRSGAPAARSAAWKRLLTTHLESSDRCAATESASGGHFDESCSCLSRRSFVTTSSWRGEKSGGRHRSRDGDRSVCSLAMT